MAPDQGSSSSSSSESSAPAKATAAKTKIVFLNGNSNTPALLVGDDPSNGAEGYEEQDNVLIVPLGTAQSVERKTVSEKEGTPEAGSED